MDLYCGLSIILVWIFQLTLGELNSQTTNRRQLCTDDKTPCIQPGSTEICSGRGNCICGNCHCKSRRGDLPLIYTGKWCECDDSRCPFYNDAVCGGSDHGVCDCGFCKCYKNYTGRNCGCSTKTDMCETSEGTICAGHGMCKCNTCQCDKGYGGPKCTECMGCDTCEANTDCVKCVVSKGTSDACEKHCNTLSINVVDDVTKNNGSQENDKLCKYKDITFVLSKDKANGISIKASQRMSKMISDQPENNGRIVTSSFSITCFALFLWILEY